jgi:hypothetical protein
VAWLVELALGVPARRVEIWLSGDEAWYERRLVDRGGEVWEDEEAALTLVLAVAFVDVLIRLP